MMHRVACNITFRLIVVITARIHVAREPREIAARDLNSDSVSSCKVVTGRHWADRDLVDLSGLHEHLFVVPLTVTCALDRFIKIVGSAVRIHIEQFYGEIRVFNIGFNVKYNFDCAA
ncbi:MAG: hypothetical protein QGI64_04965, partial [Desulfobacterales bacterium]|nr:hypothetical protein [Desulfobacterales bacterium]